MKTTIPYSLTFRCITFEITHVMAIVVDLILHAHLQPLLSLSESLLVQLKSRMAAWDERYTRIGDIFTHMVSRLITVIIHVHH